MPFVMLNNIEMFYEVQGSGNPIVLISGFSSDHVLWDTIRDLLTADYQVITFDN